MLWVTSKSQDRVFGEFSLRALSTLDKTNLKHHIPILEWGFLLCCFLKKILLSTQFRNNFLNTNQIFCLYTDENATSQLIWKLFTDFIAKDNLGEFIVANNLRNRQI